MTTVVFDRRMDRIAEGENLSPDEIRELCDASNILVLGMLADAVRRRRHGVRTTYVRVATVALDAPPGASVAASAREIRLTGAPQSLGQAVDAVARVKADVGGRAVGGFSWSDVERFAASEGTSPSAVLARLRAAGLDAVAELWLDTMADVEAAIEQLMEAGYGRLCVGVKTGGADRLPLWLRVAALQDRTGGIQALNPLPAELRAFRPTTGYDDVKAVAAARLAVPSIPSIQLDWLRYGPKLAQVALTFGADDVWGISASDEAQEGRRRAPVEEIRRNIEAAGFDPQERDGRFMAPS